MLVLCSPGACEGMGQTSAIPRGWSGASEEASQRHNECHVEGHVGLGFPRVPSEERGVAPDCGGAAMYSTSTGMIPVQPLCAAKEGYPVACT